ncbi:ecsC [Pontibacillus halophilus JSM 076056 = DSM 19796]|uniref:EcsC n=1 Tax=Pontibacillus halophilus JSM 076056 = DSM 19796 TaxID=1385510 RepID=A0A0A5GN82_9BACI|nr:EcsC family protein [Pontibacillus halophilus]KGX92615.1 ecsC [Pontibacillus halophilus JSM 076056 = DSM 19796]
MEEAQARQEALAYGKRLDKRASRFQRTSKQWQNRVTKRIPDRIHRVVTDSIRNMMELSLTSSRYVYRIELDPERTFQEKEALVEERLKTYKRTAMIQGAGSGAGGLVIGMTDFPLLLGIKMKFLFDVAQIYGFDVHRKEERMFLLHIFMMAFSEREKQREVYYLLKNWNEEESIDVDWRQLQQQYRDSLDLAKLLQFLPGFGAIVGAVVNPRLMDTLAEAAMTGYRLRLLT